MILACVIAKEKKEDKVKGGLRWPEKRKRKERKGDKMKSVKIKKRKHKSFVTRAIAKKIIANRKTPPQLKKYWKKKFKL